MKQRLYIFSFSLLFFLITAGYSLAAKTKEQIPSESKPVESSKVKISAKELKEPAVLKNKLSASEKEIGALRSKLSTLEKENSELKNKLNALNTEKSVFGGQLGALEKDKAGLKNKLKPFEKEIGAFKDRISALEKENELLKIQIDILSSRLKSFKEAETPEIKRLSFQEAIAAQKNTHYNLAYLYFQKGDSDGAIKEYRKVLKYDLRDKDTHYNLGCLYAWKGSFKEAIKEFETVLILNPNDRETYYNLATIYNKNLNDLKKAEECYQKFLENESKKKD